MLNRYAELSEKKIKLHKNILLVEQEMKNFLEADMTSRKKNKVKTAKSTVYRVRNFRGRVSNFNQSEARKQCVLASDWLKFRTLYLGDIS